MLFQGLALYCETMVYATLFYSDKSRIVCVSLRGNISPAFIFFSIAVSEIGVYTWGNNTNLTLGHDHSKKHPEKLDLRNNYTVSQVLRCVVLTLA